MDAGPAPSSSSLQCLPKGSDGADRLKAALLIAAAFATVMVGVVAARSLLLGVEHRVSSARVAR